MKVPGTVYLVGGAVRNRLMGIEESDRDWVVVGSTQSEMLDAGFVQVGRHFPVFLHPVTREEFALARLERKSGIGHQGFETQTTSVSLEQDLARRDLTINAMAMDSLGEVIDLHGGRADLAAKVLRHVSPAFGEDPLRCFRVARFLAQFPAFKVAPETAEMVSSMAPQLGELSAERVWHELQRSMGSPAPYRFIEFLQQCQLEQPWFDHVDLDAFGALLKRVKTKQPLSLLGWLPRREGTMAFLNHLKAPIAVIAQVGLVAKHGALFGRHDALDPEDVVACIHEAGGFQQNEQAFLEFLSAVSDYFGVQTSHLGQLPSALKALKVDEVQGPEYGQALRRARIAHVKRFLAQSRN